MAAVKQSFPDITKSAEDGRNYKGLELKNGLKVASKSFFLLGQWVFWSSSPINLVFLQCSYLLLQVLLVSDPSTDKAAAAMDVHIGHMSDPSNLPGLAHFCEHMLFLGWFQICS